MINYETTVRVPAIPIETPRPLDQVVLYDPTQQPKQAPSAPSHALYPPRIEHINPLPFRVWFLVILLLWNGLNAGVIIVLNHLLH